MDWPDNWEKLILKDNVLVVVGAAKSGLTNLCNLLGSLRPVYYIYGNTILKAVPVGAKDYYPMIRTAFLYDYVIPYIRGIRGCELPCAIEDKLLWSRIPQERLNKLKLNLGSVETLYYAAENRAYYATDIIDGCVRWKEYQEIFPGCNTIHLVRNGFDVITARLFMNWDTPYSYKYPCGPSVDWAVDGKPWFAEELWNPEWNDATKIAHLWRVQVDALPPSLFYEKMMADPKNWIEILLNFSPILSKTSATQAAIDSCRKVYAARRTVSAVSLNDIEEPERAKFKESMERLGYL